MIRSKNIGARESAAEVVIFLDAHCEVNTNWLPPLLAPIAEDSRSVTVPIVDQIDHTTFQYAPVYHRDERPVGIWEWGLLYKETRGIDPRHDDPEHMSASYPSPLHAGGLIAVNREYFLSLGGYDPGLLVWGGEQYELSFKVWLCGGRVVWCPCSRVGHVYRSQVPYTMGHFMKEIRGQDLVTRNLKRVVEVWMDEEHKQYFYTRHPLHKYIPIGDISEQLEFRAQCRPFSWLMANVAPMLTTEYPHPPDNRYWGLVTFAPVSSVCWRPRCIHPGCKLTASKDCELAPGRDEVVRLNVAGQLGLGERCIVPVVTSDTTAELEVAVCPPRSVSGDWRYNEDDLTMRDRKSTRLNSSHSQQSRMPSSA